jgi:hypothetical protein
MTGRHRSRKLRLLAAIAAGFGPVFLFVVLLNQAWWLAPKVGVSEAFLSKNIRWVVVVGLWVALGVSYLLLALMKRVFPPSRTAA